MTDTRLSGLETIQPYSMMGAEDLYIIPSPPMLIEEVLPKQTITGLTSFPGTGKTWLTMECMRALCTGGSFLERFPCEKGSVLFVGSDASIHDYARQWRKLTVNEWSQHQPLEGESHPTRNPFDENVRFLIQSDFLFEDISSVRRLIRTSKAFEWGHEETDDGPVWKNGFSLIIFDTLSKLTRANQNDNSQMEEVFRNIRFISEQTKASIMLLHHNAYASEFRDGESWRGASAQIAALDNWFQLNAAPNDPYHIDVKVKRFRGLTPSSFSYQMVIDEDTASIKYTVGNAGGNKFNDGINEAIVDYLKLPKSLGTWFTVEQIADGLWPEYGPNFGDDKSKFVRCVRTRLNDELAKATPTVAKQGGGKRYARAFYTGIIADKHDPEIEPTQETSGSED